MKLADAGAEVLKVEVNNGAPERTGVYEDPSEPGYNLLHSHVNRGKKSIHLNMKHPKVWEVIERLVKWADVITNNFRVGELARQGVSYERCKEWNPRVIYTTNSGFGHLGEWADKPSFDGIAQAFAGINIEQGSGATKGNPERGLVGWAFSDEVGAMNYAYAIMAALYARDHAGNGMGQKLETSQLGATIAFQGLAATAPGALHDPEHRQRDDGKPPLANLQWCFYIAKCSDEKYITTVPMTDKQWRALTVDAFGRQDIFDLAPVQPKRIEHNEAVRADVFKEFAKKSREEWIKILNKCDVPCAPVNDYNDVATNAHLRENGFIKEYEVLDSNNNNKSLGNHVQIGYPIHFMGTPVADRPGPVPMLGEHTNEYLSRMGFSGDEISTFRKEGVVGPPEDGPNPSKSKL